MTESEDLPIAVIDYGMGNLQSIVNAFKLLDENPVVVENPDDLAGVKGVVVPGVGSFPDGITNLRERQFVEPLKRLVLDDGIPYLGLCLGMQFLATESKEGGSHDGLDWISGTVRRIEPEVDDYRVPHMGWNEVTVRDESSQLYADLGTDPVFYFVHSYYFDVEDDPDACVTAEAWHGMPFTASVRRDNIYGVQFHPEKSQGAGLKLIENFLTVMNGAEENG